MTQIAKGSFADIALSLLRVITGFLFMQHGLRKMFGLLGGDQIESLMSLTALAGILELVGGPAIMVGIYTPIVAFILSGEMAVAYFMFHFSRGFWPIENRGELAALYAFIFLLFVAIGGGSYSFDRLVRKKPS